MTQAVILTAIAMAAALVTLFALWRSQVAIAAAYRYLYERAKTEQEDNPSE